MKRKVAVVALLCGLMMALTIGAAQAANFTCTVNGVGLTNSGYYFITLTDNAPGSFVNTNFILAGPGINAAVTNQFYATALTASSKSSSVVVELPGTTQWQTIQTITAQ